MFFSLAKIIFAIKLFFSEWECARVCFSLLCPSFLRKTMYGSVHQLAQQHTILRSYYILIQKPPRWLLRGNNIKRKHKALKRFSVSEPMRWPTNLVWFKYRQRCPQSDGGQSEFRLHAKRSSVS